MATLATLRTDLRNYLNLNAEDAPDSLVDTWINVAEPDVWREIRILANKGRGLLGAVSGDLYAWVLPSTWTSITNVLADSTSHTRKSLEFVRGQIAKQWTDRPAWAIDGDGNVVITTPSVTDLEITGYYRLSGLTSENMAAEDALPAVYDAYFYRSMAEACNYYDYAERFATYMGHFERAVARINGAETTLI